MTVGITRRLALLGLAASAAMPLGAGAQAVRWKPSGTVKITVPFSVGGPTDLATRAMAEALGKIWPDAKLVVENEPGGGGLIAFQEGVRAPADGSEIMIVGGQFIALPLLGEPVAYDPLKDYKALGAFSWVVSCLVVGNHVQAANFSEFVSYIRANPGKVRYGSTGPGGAPWLLAQSLAQDEQLDMVHVPYPGNSAAVADLLAGRIDFFFFDLGSALAQVQTGKARCLGIARSEPAPLAPDLPALGKELPSLDYRGFSGAVIPAATPDDIVSGLVAGLQQAAEDPWVMDRIKKLSLESKWLGPQPFGAFLSSEQQRILTIIEQSKA